MNISLLVISLFILLITIILIDFRKLMTRNLKKLDPKYMNDMNTINETRIEIDKEGNTIIIPTKRYSFDRYL